MSAGAASWRGAFGPFICPALSAALWDHQLRYFVDSVRGEAILIIAGALFW